MNATEMTEYIAGQLVDEIDGDAGSPIGFINTTPVDTEAFVVTTNDGDLFVVRVEPR